MADWDHRAATGNGSYQLYLYVVETSFNLSGVGITQLNWELGIIKVAGAGVGSSSGSVPWEVHMHGNNNGDASGTGAFNFPSGAAIGTRIALGAIAGWTFSHNADFSGLLTLNTMARAVTGISLGSPQIGWGGVVMTPFYRAAAAPAAPVLQARTSDTSWTIRAYDSTDWGLGQNGILHILESSPNSNMSGATLDYYPTTSGGAAHDRPFTPAAHTTYYFRDTIRDRGLVYASSGITAVYGRPSKPGAPELASETTTSITVNLPNPTYIGAAITARETVLVNADTLAVLQTDTTANPTFTGLTRVTAYKIRTRMTTSAGTSDWSDYADFVTPGTVPSAPTGYTVYDLSATSATVSLGSLADNGGAVPDQARVKISTTASDVGLVQTVTNPAWAPVQVSGLTKGTTYYVAEAAHNAVENGGWGAYGAWVTFTTPANVPNAPVLSAGSPTGTTSTLTWTAPTQLNGATIVSYKLTVASNPAMSVGVREWTLTPAQFAQIVDSLTAATEYYATIRTETDMGRGSTSPVVAFSTTGGGGGGSGLYIDVAGVPKFAEVWVDVAGVPKLCEVWIDVAGVPKLAVA